MYYINERESGFQIEVEFLNSDSLNDFLGVDIIIEEEDSRENWVTIFEGELENGDIIELSSKEYFDELS